MYCRAEIISLQLELIKLGLQQILEYLEYLFGTVVFGEQTLTFGFIYLYFRWCTAASSHGNLYLWPLVGLYLYCNS